jgi:hypothetical protein
MKPGATLRFMAEWPPHVISEDERAAVLAGAEVLEAAEREGSLTQPTDPRRIQRLENTYQLVQERDRLEELIAELGDLLQGLEWRPHEAIGADGTPTGQMRFFCAACGGWRDGAGHKLDCRLASAHASVGERSVAP